MITPTRPALAAFVVGLATPLGACEAVDPVPDGGASGVALPPLSLNEVMASSATFVDASGLPTDWLEIYNAGDAPVDLAGMRLCDDHYLAEGLASCHVVPAGAAAQTEVPAGGFVVFHFNGDAATSALEVPLKLGGGGDAVYLFDAGGRQIDALAWGLEDGLDQADVSYGRWPDGEQEWVRFDGGPAGSPTPGAPNGAGDAGPTGSRPPRVAGVTVTPGAPSFEQVVTIRAEASDPDGDLAEVRLVWGLDEPPAAEVAMAEGAEGAWVAEVGPFPRGGILRYLVAAIDGGGRRVDSPVARVSIAGPGGGRLVINEIMAVNASFPDDTGAFPDWVELYNAGDQAAALAGMYLADDHYSDGLGAWFAIGDGVAAVAPGGFAIFWFDKESSLGPRHVSQKLSGVADAVYLVAADGETVVDSRRWDAEVGLVVADVAIGRLPDGGEDWVLFGPNESAPATPGKANGE
ncbi:MAG: hypothetical protein CSA66_01650 [Proteobacteria bacterium]|nr:MAG: hypothetical protein CSA66_01650 [Pseudomonadota bacterium]